MEYQNIIETLLINFPELSTKYDNEKDYIEGLPHLIFEILFVPYLIKITDGFKS